MNPEDVKRYTFNIVPTIRSGKYIIKDTYRYAHYVEEGLPVIPEPEITNFAEANALIASIKAQL